MTEIIEKELSYTIVKAAYEVFNTLGPGFDEEIYEESMIVVLKKYGYSPEQQKRVEVFFQGVMVGFHKLDLVVESRVILELKAVSEIAPVHKQQALAYLKATELELALVINFGAGRLQVARVVNSKNRKVISRQASF
ncbi:MAG: GxxExxY protein [Anaerolineales bacterium]|jgi:GxxExxY protein|nr:GxxExxY protein [Chloroflexota bacterium]MBK6645441.1 GxxExxY protein [Anaerolineales bacterium]